jgi:DNA-binding transcriptional MocR family regulator
MSAERLRLAAQERGLALVTAEAFAVEAVHTAGARISLGAARKRATVERALRALAEVLSQPVAARAPMV